MYVPIQIIADEEEEQHQRGPNVQRVSVHTPPDDVPGAEQHGDRQRHAGELGDVVARPGTDRFAGSERKRSMTPSWRSVAIAVAGPVRPNASDCIRIPPMMYSR